MDEISKYLAAGANPNWRNKQWNVRTTISNGNRYKFPVVLTIAIELLE